MPLLGFLFVWSLVLSAPIILAVILARGRISRRAGSMLVAAAFACASAYTLWRLEWFDVWRHGVPGVSQLLIYACYSAAFGAIGWTLARIILANAVETRTGPRSHPSR